MAEHNQDNQPVSLRDDAPQLATPQAESHSNALVYGLGFLTLAVVIIVVLASGIFSDDNSNGLDENEVRDIVAEVVGTQVAGLSEDVNGLSVDVDELSASVTTNNDNVQAMVNDAVATEFAGMPVDTDSGDGLTGAQVQEMVDNAVATEIYLLIPTNTPIPPTPTIIPVGVAEEDDAFRGPDDAPVVIVEFSDFQCSYCGRWYQTTLQSILEEYPDQVKFVYRDFPIFGEESLRAGMATECAEEQGHFWDFHDRLFKRLTENEGTALNDETFISYAAEFEMDVDAFAECMATDRYADEVLADYQAAQNYGLRGTPGFVINGVVQAIGAQPFEVFSALIDAELAKAGS